MFHWWNATEEELQFETTYCAFNVTSVTLVNLYPTWNMYLYAYVTKVEQIVFAVSILGEPLEFMK